MSVFVENLDTSNITSTYSMHNAKQFSNGNSLHDVVAPRNSVVNTIHCANNTGQPCVIQEVVTFNHQSPVIEKKSYESLLNPNSKNTRVAKPAPPPVPPKPTSKRRSLPEMQSSSFRPDAKCNLEDTYPGNTFKTDHIHYLHKSDSSIHSSESQFTPDLKLESDILPFIDEDNVSSEPSHRYDLTPKNFEVSQSNPDCMRPPAFEDIPCSSSQSPPANSKNLQLPFYSEASPELELNTEILSDLVLTKEIIPPTLLSF